MTNASPAKSQLRPNNRLWEIDALRGVAVILMVFFHFMWDMHFFGLYQGQFLVGPWQWFARFIASMFTVLMGVSLTLTYYRTKTGQPPPFSQYFIRGAKVFGWGLVISLATYLFIGPRGFVVFGILHMLGSCMILGYPFIRLNRWLTLLLSIAAIAAGVYVNGLVSASPWFIWLGVKQIGRSMVDYYPLLPWFGVALLGIFAGQSLYPVGQRRFALKDLSHFSPVRGLRFLGRHSLLIYLIHQPIIIGILFALGFRPL